jgi:type IV pilus assembly protein PilA
MTNNFTNKPVRIEKCDGFTLIELMIVIAVTAIILTVAIPMFNDFLIRAKIAEGLNASNSVQSAITEACKKESDHAVPTASLVSYDFEPSQYVLTIDISGACVEPSITVKTVDTGAEPNPILTIRGKYQKDTGLFSWVCIGDTAQHLLPANCRS